MEQYQIQLRSRTTQREKQRKEWIGKTQTGGVQIHKKPSFSATKYEVEIQAG